MVHVRFEPGGMVCEGRAGDTLLDIALDNGIAIEHECGGNCACTTCMVCVLQGAGSLTGMEPVEDDRLDTADTRLQTHRLACQAMISRKAAEDEIVLQLVNHAGVLDNE